MAVAAREVHGSRKVVTKNYYKISMLDGKKIYFGIGTYHE